MDTVRSLCFSPDGNTLASGSSDLSIRLWDVKTKYQNAKLDGHTDAIMSVCFSPDGNTLASGSNDNSIRLWDVKTEQQKAKLDCHSNLVMSVCFSPDGNTLASGSRDESIRLWDIKNKYCSDYRFKEIQVKNTRYPFFNTPLQYIQYYGLPRLQFFKVQESFLQKAVSFQDKYWSNT